MQGAIGKLTLLKDKASEGVHKMRSKMGRNKDIQCRLHLKVTEQAHTCVGCAHVVTLAYQRTFLDHVALDHVASTVQQTPLYLPGDISAVVEEPAPACNTPGLMTYSGPQLFFRHLRI